MRARVDGQGNTIIGMLHGGRIIATEPSGSANIATQANGHVPRPPNAFILYRQINQASVKATHPGIHNNEICEYSTIKGTVHDHR